MENLLNSIFLVAVNCFVLISGYFLSTTAKPFTFKKFLKLAIQISFYSFTVYLIFVVCGIEVLSLSELIKNILPFLFDKYWFVTWYLVMFICSPLLNLLIKKIAKKQYTLLICFILLCCLLSGNAAISSFTFLSNGFSPIWFLFLYLIAGYIKKYDKEKIKNWMLIVAYLIGLIGCVLPWLIPAVNDVFIIKLLFNMPNVVSYTSLTVVVSTMALFTLFKRIKINQTSFIGKSIILLASTGFGIYLIHDNLLVRAYMYENIFHTYAFYSSRLAFVYLILFIAIVFSVCFLIDLGRQVAEKYIIKLWQKLKTRKGKKETS